MRKSRFTRSRIITTLDEVVPGVRYGASMPMRLVSDSGFGEPGKGGPGCFQIACCNAFQALINPGRSASSAEPMDLSELP